MTYRFASFELDPAAWQLRKDGQAIRLERRPMDLLLLLVERHHELVTREDIAVRLWGPNAFIEADTGVNTAIRKVRRVLEDSSDTPRFIETVQGKGYRFIAAVTDGANAASTRPAREQRTRLAVLPFAVLSDSADYDYLSDGLTEETIAALGQVDPAHLAVVGRTTVLPFRASRRPLDEVGRALNAEFLVESSIRGEGKRVRITSKLIRARDQEQIWSTSYDSTPASLLDFQRELGSMLAEQISSHISPERFAALARRQTTDAEAYDLYIRGRHFWNQLTGPTTKRAIDCYTQAVQRDASYALAWAGIADALASSPITGDAPPAMVAPRAREAAREAIKFGPTLAEAHVCSGTVDFFLDWNWSRAEHSYCKAVACDGEYALAHRMLGVVSSHAGKHEQARAAMRRARELDIYAMHYALSAMVEFHAREFVAAREFAIQATVLSPDFWIGYYHLAQVQEALGEYRLALKSIATATRLVGPNSKLLGMRGWLLAKLGEDVTEILATIDAVSAERYVPPYAKALIFTARGEHELALDWLEKCLAVRDVHVVFLPVDPKWDGLRAERRFEAITAEVNRVVK
jgi:TolB-like protein